VTDDNLIRAEFTKTLFSEMGHGNHKRIHSVLFKEFANELINKMGGEPDESLFILDETKLLSETLALNSWEKVTYSKNLVSACGAQLAIEWQAYTMIQKLYEGARNYMGFWPEGDAFHEACEYFYSHLGEAEKEHKEESYKASVELLNHGANFDEFKQGFNEHLNKIGAFWDAMAIKIKMEACHDLPLKCLNSKLHGI
jgi:pyrroloquinoline quinone (PQQ) biosynthesis protein C